MKGAVPPVAEAVKVMTWPEVGVRGVKVKSGTKDCGVTLTLAVPAWLMPFASCAVAVTPCKPFTAKIVV